MPERPRPPRGMRDFLPDEALRRHALLELIREAYRKYGFREIETPALEDLATLTTSQGGENEKLIFQTLRRGLDPTATPASIAELTDYGLRFDLTVPLSRYFATNQSRLPLPFRAFQAGPVWRAERPQRGRYRQFIQCDIDIIGEPSIFAECELLSGSIDALRAIGLSQIRIRLNDRRLLLALLAALGFTERLAASALITIDKVDKIGVDGVVRSLRDDGYPDGAVAQLEGFLPKMAQAGMTAEAIVDALPPGIDPSLIADLEAIRAAVLAQATEAVVIDLDLTLVRGMGYYTGPIFEIEHPDFPGSIAGGGRYDDMVGRFLQRPVPACGISLGFERLVEIVTQETSSQEKRLAFVFERDSAALTDLSREARKLRDDGYIVEPIQGKPSVSRKRLSADGYEFVVIAGSGDVPERLVPQVDRPPASA